MPDECQNYGRYLSDVCQNVCQMYPIFLLKWYAFRCLSYMLDYMPGHVPDFMPELCLSYAARAPVMPDAFQNVCKSYLSIFYSPFLSLQIPGRGKRKPAWNARLAKHWVDKQAMQHWHRASQTYQAGQGKSSPEASLTQTSWHLSTSTRCLWHPRATPAKPRQSTLEYNQPLQSYVSKMELKI